MNTPEIMTDRAIAKIGNAKVFGRLTKDGDTICFEGNRLKMPYQVKDIVKTILNRFRKGKLCSITSYSTNLTWDSKTCNLISYGVGLGCSKGNVVRFTLMEYKYL